jgi:hypothetical protein
MDGGPALAWGRRFGSGGPVTDHHSPPIGQPTASWTALGRGCRVSTVSHGPPMGDPDAVYPSFSLHVYVKTSQ